MKLAANRTPAEETLLAELLVAVRKAVRSGHQLSIIVDPWPHGEAVHASFMFDPAGYQVEIPGPFRARRARPPPAAQKGKRSGATSRKRTRSAGRLSPKAAQRGTCRECGCTEDDACMTKFGPCSWVNAEHTLCSGCAP